jgi:hypothetical protein
MTSHQYDYHYQKEFFRLKKTSLDIGGKVVMDMLAYYDENTQISSLVNHLGSILTFSDSAFSCKTNEESLVLDFAKKYFLDDGGNHFFNLMFKCSDSTSR